MRRALPVAGMMVLVWGLMLLLFIAIEKLVVPIPTLPESLGGPLATGVVKALLSFSLALLWLYVWHSLVKLYRRRALKPSPSQ